MSLKSLEGDMRDMVKKTKTKKKKRKRKATRKKPPTFSKPSDKYGIALWKWLKVVLWYHEDLKAKVVGLEKRIEKLEETVKLIRDQLELKGGDSKQ